ncbi:MAG: hypothetical protein BWY88_00283 [Synergistetes bacterium ADurb.Bin520]|nr:MAG: hypothetical protein BWY88_00283 [Synergistetes bacterium ADurb.Bin520]
MTPDRIPRGKRSSTRDPNRRMANAEAALATKNALELRPFSAAAALRYWRVELFTRENTAPEANTK